MSETGNKIDAKIYAVVTGANKGIGFEICRQLAFKGITTVLTARDINRGLEAVQKLQDNSEISEYVKFHQLDVADLPSIDSLAELIGSQFRKLDILVNNAGVIGATLTEKFTSAIRLLEADENSEINWDGTMTQTYEEATNCLQTNFYGAKRMSEALIPLLQLSDSPRIVNVSTGAGKLKNIPNNEWAKKMLRDSENEESIDQVIDKFLKDFKEGHLAANGWPNYLAAYKVSKAAMNSYTKILAKKYPDFKINSVCPGFVKTDINLNAATLPVEEGAESIVRITLMPRDGPSGLFFVQDEAYLEDS